MPPHDHDRSSDPDARPPFGWGAEPEPKPELDYDPDTVPVVHPIRLLWCWRCGETAEPVAGRCPWCGTWTDGEPPKPPRARPVDEPEDDWHTEAGAVEYAIPVRRPHLIPPVVIVSAAYVALLGALIASAVLALLLGMATPDEMENAQALAGLFTGSLTLGSLALVWSASRQKVPDGTTAVTWVASVPVPLMLLGVNVAIMLLARELQRRAGMPEPERLKLTLLTVLLICVQPAIFEELFFRQMTLGVLRKLMNVHLAIWITGAVFAFAHLQHVLTFNIIGVGYLFLVGAFLGYARAYGGLPLAMLLHFLHNLAVVAVDAYRP